MADLEVRPPTYGSGELDPERVIPAAHRTMEVILAPLADLAAGQSDGEPVALDPVLRRQLLAWGSSRSTDAPPEPHVLLLGLTAWTRLHGVISLEIEGFFEQIGVDSGRLYETEVDRLIAQAAATHGHGPVSMPARGDVT